MMDAAGIGNLLARGRQFAMLGITIAVVVALLHSSFSRDDRETLSQYKDRLEDVLKAYRKDNNLDPSAIRVRAFKEDALPAGELAPPPETIGQARRPAEKEEPREHDSFERMFKPSPRAAREGGAIEFPPTGLVVAEMKARVYYPVQKTYSQATLKVVKTNKHTYLFGAALCEEVSDGSVILAPCVYLESLARPRETADYEAALSKTVLLAMDLEFAQWARYSTSYLGCAGPGEFRMSVQFGEKPEDTLVTIRLPYSSDRTDALAHLEKAQKEPCKGVDIFVPLQGAIQLVSVLSDAWEE